MKLFLYVLMNLCCILTFPFSAMTTALRTWLFSSASERVVARLRKNLFGHLIQQVWVSISVGFQKRRKLHCSLICKKMFRCWCSNNLLQEIAFFDVTRTGELLSRLSEDTQIIKNAATTNLSEALRNVTTALIGIGFMFTSSWKLTCKWFIFISSNGEKLANWQVKSLLLLSASFGCCTYNLGWCSPIWALPTWAITCDSSCSCCSCIHRRGLVIDHKYWLYN